MNRKKPEDVTFQITVGRLALSSPLPEQDIRVTVCVGDMSKITCSGIQSTDGLTITWNHPFLFSASLSMTVRVAIWTLPDKLSTEWDKQSLGDQIVTSVADLLESDHGLQCNVYKLPIGPAALFTTCNSHDVLIAPDGHNDCLSALRAYTQKLYRFGTQSNNISCMSTKIEMNLARLDLCSLGHADHVSVLNDLAISFQFHYTQSGNMLDLNRAIEIQQTRLDLCPEGHSEHAKALGELAISLFYHYKIQRNKEDLRKLIEMQQKWLNLCPPNHPGHPKVLGELAKSYLENFKAGRNTTDLHRSIKMGERMVVLCPTGHKYHKKALRILAESLAACYQVHGNVTDLDKAINLRERYLQLCPPGHPSHGFALQSLALSLQDHYNQMKDPLVLVRKIKLLKNALDTYPVHHQYFASNVVQLATTLLSFDPSLPRALPNEHLSSQNEAFETYRLLRKCGPAASLDLWEATQSWVENAEKHGHSSVLEAYQTSLNTLDHFTSLNPSLDERHGIMQARAVDLANNAFSSATRHGDFKMAVEFLEQGRGILWNQLARFDISIAALDTHGDRGRALGSKFAESSEDLRKQAQGSGDTDTDPYWRVQEEWRAIVDEIRCLDGFSGFLLPPCFNDLQPAAEDGPVLIINASEYSCDALIVLRAGPPIHVSLPCSYADVDKLCLQLLELTQDAHAYGENRESWVREMLRDIWSSVVGPIASVLENDIALALGSRIWWCPTSKFTTLPLHAAGPYRKGQKNFMDLYVSSYAPSLSGLIRTRERARAQRNARDDSGSADTLSFAAVGQARPGGDSLQLGELVEVEREIRQIRNETGMPPRVKFKAVTRNAATVEGAVQAFRDHRWVHLACHGAQHATKPFDSWFAMGDGKLTLMRIIQERYTGSEFAFLSACHTAVGDASTPNEVLHLAAGMQFAEFNGVIGTLWRVDDAVAHRFVTRFYQEMFQHPEVDFERAAAALNTAALETAGEVSLEKRIVFVHIGI